LEEPAEAVLDGAGGEGVPVGIVENYPIANETVCGIHGQVVEEGDVGGPLADLLDPVPGDVLAGEEAHVPDLLGEPAARVKPREELDEIPDDRPGRLGIAVLDTVDRTRPARRGLGEAESTPDHAKERRGHGDRVPVTGALATFAARDQGVQVPLLVVAAEA